MSDWRRTPIFSPVDCPSQHLLQHQMIRDLKTVISVCPRAGAVYIAHSSDACINEYIDDRRDRATQRFESHSITTDYKLVLMSRGRRVRGIDYLMAFTKSQAPLFQDHAIRQRSEPQHAYIKCL